ncbi:hypothetical protein [Stenomitos frigidus]|uniref:Uncharacterized protein n=1 Tax=Stenomitos frigidus ULC18 TaxID=2107698 RepID=A0A2T1EFQ8_9CYAN|nr:hypothetical protein [Stenomitos frigidus]PSB31587.1 hypothetical protein C7B82_07110 [Stenomitos frigidus ULC18]
MIEGSEMAQRVKELLSEGLDLEAVLYQVTQETLQHVPAYLQNDPYEISEILSAAQFYAHQAHPEFISAAKIHDIVLLRLLPKPKTERYIQQLEDEAKGE